MKEEGEENEEKKIVEGNLKMNESGEREKREGELEVEARRRKREDGGRGR
jgi:hypothetical protein